MKLGATPHRISSFYIYIHERVAPPMRETNEINLCRSQKQLHKESAHSIHTYIHERVAPPMCETNKFIVCMKLGATLHRISVSLM